MNRRYFPLAAPARMSAQRAAAATPPAIAAAPARAAAVPARAAALAVRGGGAGRRGGGSSGMVVVVEAARRGKQLGEVHGFAAAAVEFVDLGAESAGEDHRARRGFPQPGQQGALGAGFAHLAVADLEAEVAGAAAAAGLQVLGLGAGRGQQLLVRVPAEHGVLVAVHLAEHRRPR